MTDVPCAHAPVRGYWRRIAIVILCAAAGTTVLHIVVGGGAFVATVTHGVVYSSCIGALAGLILPPLRHRLLRAGPVVEWGATLLGLLVVAVAGTFIACAILGALGYDRGQMLTQRFANRFEMNALITAIIGIAMTLYESQRARLDALTLELRTKELERERDHKMALEAKLSSLESRLHPHFLFNTLNAISELIHENPERAERTVERLATLLRAALDVTGRNTVPLVRELEIVGDYLEIEKTRLGERLHYGFDVAPDAGECEMLPLAVQTLVENSIKHAIAPRPSGGRVRVEARTDNGRVVVGVWDDGPGFQLAAAIPGHGLENLQSRLHGRFGDAATLSVGRRDGGTLVTVALPRASVGA